MCGSSSPGDTTRSVPSAHCARRANSIEVRGDALSFTREEAEDLLEILELELSGPSVDALLRRTGGWATGLILASQWLAGRDDPAAAVEHFDGDNRAVADYLVSEIIAGLDDSERQVVMAASVSEVVDAALAGELAARDDTGEMLERVARRNAFLSRIEGTAQYRFHPILHSFLRAEAHRRDATAAAGHHIRAARWYAARGDGADAVDQALRSGSRRSSPRCSTASASTSSSVATTGWCSG